MSNFKYGDLTEKIIGAAFRVHNTLGQWFPGSNISEGIRNRIQKHGIRLCKRI